MSDDLVMLTLGAYALGLLILLLALMALMFWLGGRDGRRHAHRDQERIAVRDTALAQYRQAALEAGVPVAVVERIDHDIAVVDQPGAQEPVVAVGRHAKEACRG